MNFFKENQTALLHFYVLSRTWTVYMEDRSGNWVFGSLPARMELV